MEGAPSREYIARVFATRRLTFSFTDSAVEVFGEVAIERLHYTAVATAPARELTQQLVDSAAVCRARFEACAALHGDAAGAVA
jgi:hypothetical protein